MTKDRGITLVALIITVIVLLILAGVAISTALNSEGLISKTNTARTETLHANVYEQLLFAQLKFMADNATLSSSQSLIEYLQERSIIGEEIGENTGKYQVNVEALFGSKQSLGNGNATVELKDVYMLERESISTGSISSTKIASTKPVKIAAANEQKETYRVVYYGESGTIELELGKITVDPKTNNSLAEDYSDILFSFYEDKTWQEVENTNMIQGYKADCFMSGDEEENYPSYIVYRNGIYKVTYSDANQEVVGGVTKENSNVDFTTFGAYSFKGLDILITPSTPEDLFHVPFIGPDTFNFEYEGNNISFTGYKVVNFNNGMTKYYTLSGELAYSIELIIK